jgi:predicted membrane-bound mannosyltransferase
MKSINHYKKDTMKNFNRYAAFSLRAVLAATVVMFGIIRSNHYVSRATPAAFAAAEPAPGALQWRQTSGPDGAVINCLLSYGPNLFAGTSAGGVFRSTNQG